MATILSWFQCDKEGFVYVLLIHDKFDFYIFHSGNKFLELPYVVKGMDVSFSGLLSFIEVIYSWAHSWEMLLQC